MKTALAAALAALAFVSSSPSPAALPVGALAPDFATHGALGGKDFAFRLATALKKGPVVLYFYPKAFTPGCTMEAHAFAAAIGDFHKAGASVLGMSADDLPTLARFSTSECQSRFPVAVADPAVIKAYDVAFARPDGSTLAITNRTSYVIAADGRIAFVHSDLDWRDHVRLALAAVQGLKPH
ncbi:MAG: peroxiredoxin [Sphingomonadales bacterium]|nr:peroxiredoxin [Sphingomonadales bacterium]